MAAGVSFELKKDNRKKERFTAGLENRHGGDAGELSCMIVAANLFVLY